ncbi:PIR protein [Plasmodium vivax]|uniref:VIR protein n=1 Tax=Plasmodium vivax TaxID=5855 RepID=A0A565A6R7_PLAVI|nr:PIR protein [Plasmodium vivax]
MTQLDLRGLLGQIFDLPSKELPSQNFYYNLLIPNKKLSQYYKECKAEDFPHKNDTSIKTTCAKLVEYLKNNYKEQNQGHLKDHHCNLLSHWIYEQLVKKLILSNVLKDSNEPQASECLRSVHILRFNNWKESKDLYDYCVDYDKIMQLAGSSYEKCKEYEKYIKEKSPFYEKFDELYIREYKDKNEEFYKKCKGYNPKIVLPKLKCDEMLPEHERSKGVSHGQGLLASTPFSGQNSNSTKTFGNVFLRVVVTSMTSGMLYKFTPLGRRFRNGLGWNNYTASDLNNEERMLFAQTHDPFSPHSEEREHHIGYLPA